MEQVHLIHKMLHIIHNFFYINQHILCYIWLDSEKRGNQQYPALDNALKSTSILTGTAVMAENSLVVLKWIVPFSILKLHKSL